MTDDLDPAKRVDGRREAEYGALRATIRERGTVRMALLPIIFIGWGALAVASAAVIGVALGTLVPLLVLAAGFEAIFALHVNVEHVGRYLQVFHEQRGEEWEHVAMEYGRQYPRSGPDPLFARVFIFSASVNFFPAALGGESWEVIGIGICHLGLIYRIRMAQTFVATQRAEDLRKFATLRAGSPIQPPPPEQGPTPGRPTE